MIADLKIKDLPIIRVEYLEGAPPSKVYWRVGSTGYVTNADPSFQTFFEEMEAAIKSQTEKAIWFVTNVPSKNYESQIAIRIKDGGRLMFNFNILQKPEELDSKRWDEIITGAQMAFNQIVRRPVSETLH
jgi:gamma-glutamylcysteine synthetase